MTIEHLSAKSQSLLQDSETEREKIVNFHNSELKILLLIYPKLQATWVRHL